MNSQLTNSQFTGEQKKVYAELFEKYNHDSSFLIYSSSKTFLKDDENLSKSTSDDIDYNNAFSESQNHISFHQMVLMLNPSAHQEKRPDKNFSAFHNTNITDRQLRQILIDSPFQGAFISDLVTDFIESDARYMLTKFSEWPLEQREKAYQLVLEKADLLAKGMTNNEFEFLLMLTSDKKAKQFEIELVDYINSHVDKSQTLFNKSITFYSAGHPGRQGKFTRDDFKKSIQKK